MEEKSTMKRMGEKTEIEVLKLYSTNPTGEFHLRQMARKVGMEHTSLRPHLDSLESKGVIKEESQGRNKVFSLNPNSDLLPYYMIQAEADRTAAFLGGSKPIRSFWSTFRNRIPLEERLKIETLILFGSFARGTEDKGSDIDVFMSASGKVAEKVQQTCDKLEAVVGYPINIEGTRNLRNFVAQEATDTFNEIVTDHIILVGIDKFVQAIRWFTDVR